MGGFYNVIFGMNKASDVILATLGLDRSKVGRFRDCGVADGEIYVYTRNGGGNRGCCNCDCWSPSKSECHNEFCITHGNHQPDEYGDCGDPACHGCIMQHRLPRHPLYLRDKDDEFDYTYATVYFRIPPEYAEGLKALESGEPWNPDERWLNMLRSIGADV